LGNIFAILIFLKVNFSHYGHGEAPRFPGVLRFQVSRQSSAQGDKCVYFKHRLPLPLRILMVLLSVRSWAKTTTFQLIRNINTMSIVNLWLSVGNVTLIQKGAYVSGTLYLNIENELFFNWDKIIQTCPKSFLNTYSFYLICV
jgi:hypothetical protein